MSETIAAPNNKALAFKGKIEHEPAGVTNAAPMKKKPSKALRKKASHAVKRGMISPKAAAKHLGDY